MAETQTTELAELTSEIVASYVAKNSVRPGDLPALIMSIYQTLGSLGHTASPPPAIELKPAVPIKKSVTDDFIISLEDGRKFKSLKRHLTAEYGMTPNQYREKWGLPADYPMVAPAYAKQRSALAKSLGLGRKASKTEPATDAPPAPSKTPRSKAGKVAA